MTDLRVAGAIRIDCDSREDANYTYHALYAALHLGLPGELAEALCVVKRDRVVLFGQPDAVSSLSQPVRAVRRA